MKILNFNAGASLSKQRHKLRTEIWIYLSGDGRLELQCIGILFQRLPTYYWRFIKIHKNAVHQFHAKTSCRILEIQYGPNVTEDDIERL